MCIRDSRLAAYAVGVFHFAYVAFLVVGLILIVIGIFRSWQWIRSHWFRYVHLTMIGFVVFEAWMGITCPLTTWENKFRRLAGETTYKGDFIANAVHDLLFFDLPPTAFTVIYSAFGLLVFATFLIAPPRRNRPAGSV